MQVTPINNSNSAINFNGTVDKGIKKYIEKQVKNHIEASLDNANKYGNAINKKDLTRIKENSTTMMVQLEKFMEQLHPDTKLKYSKGYLRSPFVYLQNGKDKVSIRETTHVSRIVDADVLLENARPMYDVVTIEKYFYDITMILSKMSNFIKDFTGLNPKQIDEAMFLQKFENANFEIMCFYENKSFFSLGLKMKNAIKRFYKFANDIGKDEQAKSMIQEAKEKAKSEANEKRLEYINKQKENAKIVNDNNEFVKKLLK